VGPDDNIQGNHKDIRSKEEIEKWRRKDPIKQFEKFLIKDKILRKEDLGRINRESDKEVKEAHQYAKRCAYPNPKELVKYVFKES
jgi:TPP-dependent pyruvate/acetoin dehydrogenase alpha subunit